MVPRGSIRLTFPCWCCWIHMERISIPMGHGHKANRKRQMHKHTVNTNKCKGLPEENSLPSSMSWSSVRIRMMLGRTLRMWRSLCGRDLTRYPDRYPEPWATGRIPTRSRRRRRRRGAKSPCPAIMTMRSHLLCPLFHTQKSAPPSLDLGDRTQEESDKNKIHTNKTLGKISDGSLAKPLQGTLPYKCTRLGWCQLVNQSLMMH